MKVGLFLGSFDPPHLGHLFNAHYALNMGMDEVWVTPAWVNPVKTNQTPYDNRLDMCKLMFNTDERIKVSDFDKYAKSHYTYEGLQKLLQAEPNNEYYIIGGTDVIESIGKWKNAEWVLENFKTIKVPRIGVTTDMCNLGIMCSSSEIKRMLKDGKSVIPFLNNDVINYIGINNLYGNY